MNKKAAISPSNEKDNKCYQYAVTSALNHHERITKIKPFINKYKWERINFTSKKDDWKKNLKSNVTIVFDVLYVKKEKIYPAYVSKHNLNHKKQVKTKSEGQRWHYLAVKKLSALLRWIT